MQLSLRPEYRQQKLRRHDSVHRYTRSHKIAERTFALKHDQRAVPPLRKAFNSLYDLVDDMRAQILGTFGRIKNRPTADLLQRAA